MFLKLADEKTFLNLIEYNNENREDIKIVLNEITIEEIKKICTSDNLKDVQVIDELSNICAEFYDRTLGKEITLNTEVDQITIHLVERTLVDKVSELSDKLTQAQADIAYISVLSDIDTTTTEEETSNESSI